MKDITAHTFPFLNHSCEPLGFGCSEIVRFSTVVANVIEFPLLPLETDNFPVTVTQSIVGRKLKMNGLSAIEFFSFKDRSKGNSGNGPKLALWILTWN